MSLAGELKAAYIERRKRFWGNEEPVVRLPPVPMDYSGMAAGRLWFGLDHTEFDSNPKRGADIIRAVLKVCNISRADFLSHRRQRNVAEARQLAYYFMRHCTRLSLPQIGHLVGDRHHATVLYGIRRVGGNAQLFGARARKIAQDLRISVPGESPLWWGSACG